MLDRDKSGVPKAYLNYVVMNKDSVVIDQGYVPVSEAAKIQTGHRGHKKRRKGKGRTDVGVDSVAHEALAVDLDIAEEGYLYTYVSNESNWDVDVHFDEMAVASASSAPLIVQSNDFYPFGLTHQQPLENPSNKYLYQGKEWQDELNLGVFDFSWRSYDPAIARTWQQDPEADSYTEWSPYSWGMGSPTNTIDPTGRNVYRVTRDGILLLKEEAGDHRFISSDGAWLDAFGKDASFVGGALATAGPSSSAWASLGSTQQADQLRTLAGLYNSQQLKNTFNDFADMATGVGGLRQLFKQGYRGLLKYFGDDVAEQGASIGNAQWAQTTFSSVFSRGGRFAGSTVDEVAAMLRSGQLSPTEVPIDVVVRNGNTLILNTRSSVALTKAGIPRSQWNVVNRTGDSFFENQVTRQLQRNSLSSGGTNIVRQSGTQNTIIK